MFKAVFIASLMISSLSFAQTTPPVPAAPAVPAVPAAPPAATTEGATKMAPNSMMKKVTDKAIVHINSASTEDLAKLPGIGPVKAKAIVDGRPYKSVEDLKNIKGIKEGVMAKIRSMIAL